MSVAGVNVKATALPTAAVAVKVCSVQMLPTWALLLKNASWWTSKTSLKPFK
jgi:hypothetical protein